MPRRLLSETNADFDRDIHHGTDLRRVSARGRRKCAPTARRILLGKSFFLVPGASQQKKEKKKNRKTEKRKERELLVIECDRTGDGGRE
jgi:hypothetical protein